MIRPATHADTAALVRIWHDAWHDAHDGYVPPGLVRARTRATFEERGATWLSVVAGNARARRFYERQGYADAGPIRSR